MSTASGLFTGLVATKFLPGVEEAAHDREFFEVPEQNCYLDEKRVYDGVETADEGGLVTQAIAKGDEERKESPVIEGDNGNIELTFPNKDNMA